MAKDDLAPRDGLIIPVSYRIVGPDAQTPGSAGVIEDAADEIGAFLHRQREGARAGIIDQHRAQLELPDLDLLYVRNQGQEMLTLRPRVRRPAIEVEPQPAVVPPEPTIPEPTFPDNDPLCLLVLYTIKADDLVAAIPMVQLDAPVSFAPIYVGGVPKSGFKQPVLTAQFPSGSISFIHTDVDFTNKKLKASILCTTRLTDCFSMGTKVLPVFNYDTSQYKPTTDQDTLTLFTCVGAFTYTDHKFKAGTRSLYAGKNTPCAINSQGLSYYGPTFQSMQATSIVSSVSQADTDIVTTAQNDATKAAVTYVSAYTANWVFKIDSEQKRKFSDAPTANVIDYPGQPGRTYTVYTGQVITTIDNTENDSVIETANVSPNNDPTLPPEHQYQYDVSLFMGISYYATATLGNAMTIGNFKIATSVVYYYTFNIETNYFENIRPTTGIHSDFGGTLPRMVFEIGADLRTTFDAVLAEAIYTTTLKTLVTQEFPGWGGDMFGGQTQVADTNYYSSDGHTHISNGDLKSLGVRATVDPNPHPPPNASYDVASEAAAQVTSVILTPLPGPNGGLGGTRTFNAFNDFSSRGVFDNSELLLDSGSHLYYAGPGTVTNTSSSPSGGDIGHQPGVKAQQTQNTYSYSIAWMQQTLTGYSDDQDNVTQDETIIVEPFPYGGAMSAYYTKVSQPRGIDQPTTTVIVTPYETFDAYKRGDFKPWLHIANQNHTMVGFMTADVPHLYLDKQEALASLAKTLGCLPNSIASCYFDIRLSTIRALAKVPPG